MIRAAADPLLDGLNAQALQRDLTLNGKAAGQDLGTALRRITWHYWYHIRETQAMWQILGHRRSPAFVGDIEELAPFPPE